MYICSIDTKNHKIKIEGSQDPKNLVLDFIIEGKDGEKVNLKNVSFGYQLESNDKVIFEDSWPVRGIRFAEVGVGSITSVRKDLKIDTDYRLLVWYASEDHRDADAKIFNTGKPFKEYDSMVWNDETEEWEYLKPYPEVSSDEPISYFWNEEILDWEEDLAYKEYFLDLYPEQDSTNDEDGALNEN